MRSRAATWILRSAGLATAMFVAVAAGSCRDIVQPDSIDAVQELCTTLTDCYGDAAFACDTLMGRARDAAPSVMGSFLQDFEEERCLTTCTGSKLCVDHPALCVDNGGECSVREECCDWSGGLSQCAEGACCKRGGVACASDAECCDAPCIEGASGVRTCGGGTCTVNDKDCRWSYECCSGQCELAPGQPDGGGKICVPPSCAEPGEPCLTTGECCGSGDPGGFAYECAASPSGGKTCQPVATCVDDGALCDPTSESSCCAGSSCELAVATLEFVCVPPGCGFEGFDCADDGDCCGADLICVFDVQQSFCQPSGGCAKAGELCGQDGECCSGKCDDGACRQGTGVVCDPLAGTCHSPLQTGPVIPSSNACTFYDACVGAVEEADRFCACTQWDALCVQAYLACVAG